MLSIQANVTTTINATVTLTIEGAIPNGVYSVDKFLELLIDHSEGAVITIGSSSPAAAPLALPAPSPVALPAPVDAAPPASKPKRKYTKRKKGGKQVEKEVTELLGLCLYAAEGKPPRPYGISERADGKLTLLYWDAEAKKASHPDGGFKVLESKCTNIQWFVEFTS